MMTLVRPGELITCQNGHIVAEVLPQVRGFDYPGSVRAGLWRPGAVASAGKCACGSPFWRPGAWHVNNRGWVEVPEP